jgi:hypothetical protein
MMIWVPAQDPGPEHVMVPRSVVPLCQLLTVTTAPAAAESPWNRNPKNESIGAPFVGFKSMVNWLLVHDRSVQNR